MTRFIATLAFLICYRVAFSYEYDSPNVGVFFYPPSWCATTIESDDIPFQASFKAKSTRISSRLYSLYASCFDGMLERLIIPKAEYGVPEEYLLGNFENLRQYPFTNLLNIANCSWTSPEGYNLIYPTTPIGAASKRLLLYRQYQWVKSNFFNPNSDFFNLCSTFLTDFIDSEYYSYAYEKQWDGKWQLIDESETPFPWFVNLRLKYYDFGDVFKRKYSGLPTREEVNPACESVVNFLGYSNMNLERWENDYHDVCPTISELILTNNCYFASNHMPFSSSRMIANDLSSTCSTLSIADMSFKKMMFSEITNFDHYVYHNIKYRNNFHGSTNYQVRATYTYGGEWSIDSISKLPNPPPDGSWHMTANTNKDTYANIYTDTGYSIHDHLNAFNVGYGYNISLAHKQPSEIIAYLSLNLRNIIENSSPFFEGKDSWHVYISSSEVGSSAFVDVIGIGPVIVGSCSIPYGTTFTFFFTDTYCEYYLSKSEHLCNGFVGNCYNDYYLPIHKRLFNAGILRYVNFNFYEGLFKYKGKYIKYPVDISDKDKIDCMYRLNKLCVENDLNIIKDLSPDLASDRFKMIGEEFVSSTKSIYDDYCADVLGIETNQLYGLNDAMISRLHSEARNNKNAKFQANHLPRIDHLIVSNINKTVSIYYKNENNLFEYYTLTYDEIAKDPLHQVGYLNANMQIHGSLFDDESTNMPISVYSHSSGCMKERWTWNNMRPDKGVANQ